MVTNAGTGNVFLFFGSSNASGYTTVANATGSGSVFYYGAVLTIFSSGSVGNNGTFQFQGPVKIHAGTFATLPSCVSSTQGSLSGVTDSTTTTWGATITGTGANSVLAYCDGTHWTVAGK